MAELVRFLEAVRMVNEGDLYDPLVVAGVGFFNLDVLRRLKPLDGGFFPPISPGEPRVKGKADFIPGSQISRGLAPVIDVAAFQITEVADVVGRLVSAGLEQGGLSFCRKKGVLGKDGVKGDLPAVFFLPPHPEMAGKPVLD